jgi:hypothetical protein
MQLIEHLAGIRKMLEQGAGPRFGHLPVGQRKPQHAGLNVDPAHEAHVQVHEARQHLVPTADVQAQCS